MSGSVSAVRPGSGLNSVHGAPVSRNEDICILLESRPRMVNVTTGNVVGCMR